MARIESLVEDFEFFVSEKQRLKIELDNITSTPKPSLYREDGEDSRQDPEERRTEDQMLVLATRISAYDNIITRLRVALMNLAVCLALTVAAVLPAQAQESRPTPTTGGPLYVAPFCFEGEAIQSYFETLRQVSVLSTKVYRLKRRIRFMRKVWFKPK